MKKIVLLLLCFIIPLSSAFAAESGYETTAEYLLAAVPNPSVASIGGEWTVLGLARSGADCPEEYFEKYYQNVEEYVKEKKGILHSRKYTEYSRVVTALCAIGKNPRNVCGYDLTLPLSDYEATVRQGINGAVWALIALDCSGLENNEICEKYISHILEHEKKDGGWALSDSEQCGEIDITAMTLTALSRHTNRNDVNEAVMRGIEFLSQMQNTNGGYSSYNTETSESTAQVLTAISSLGISVDDTRFVKNGNTLVDNILSFRHTDGSFSHTDKPNLMATEQCFYALTSQKRFEDGETSLFDMSDVNFDVNSSEFRRDDLECLEYYKTISEKVYAVLKGGIR